MRVAGLLLALVLVTSCFVGGTFAKYVTSGHGNDSARAAKWGVVVNVEGDSAFAKHMMVAKTHRITLLLPQLPQLIRSWLPARRRIMSFLLL